jgi:hypothetical protein
VEESLAEGTFGIHPIDDLTAFCIEKESLKHRVWVGGKDDWLVILDNRCSLTLNNIITRDTIPLPSLTTMCQFQISTLYDLEIVNEVCSRRLRRVVLCHTPSSIKDYMVIALFDNRLIASTSKGDVGWKTLRHPTFWAECLEYYVLTFVDVVLHRGRLVVVEEYSCMYSWDIDRPQVYPLKLTGPNLHHFEESPEITFYLAKSPDDELLVICVHGNHARYFEPLWQVLINEHDRFYNIDAMTVYKFDDAKGTWQRIHTIGGKHSIFVGLNYPFHMDSECIKPNSVCVADLADNDVVIFSMEPGKEKSMQLIDLHTRGAARMLDRHSMRTPMWFRPTRPSRANKLL